MTKVLTIRADASSQIGNGHVMRCLALAQAWQDLGGHCVFIMSMDAGPLFERLQQENIEIVRITAAPGSLADAAATIAVAGKLQSQWLVLDGYHFTAAYQQSIKNSGLQLLVIDDNCEQEHYYADLIVNQNIHADENLYPAEKREPYTQLLIGTKYCLLRREFLKIKNVEREIPDKARKILVTMGGADPDNVTGKVLKALEELNDAELSIKLVIGGNNPHRGDIEKEAMKLPGKTEVIFNASNMPELMGWADMAISAAGSTTWEMCFMGLPFILVIVAENQRLLAEKLEKLGIPEKVHARNTTSAAIAKTLRRLNHASFKQHILAMQELMANNRLPWLCRKMNGHELKLRRATTEDCEILWHWANEPQVRANSFASDPIPWETHIRWFEQKQNDPNATIYIAEISGQHRCGYVRAEYDHCEAVISVLISPEFRGQHLGAELIDMGSEKIFYDGKIDKIIAYIKIDNLPSLLAFRHSGYEDQGKCNYHGHICHRLIRVAKQEKSS